MPRYSRWWTFAIVCLALFMGMLDNLVVVTALPSIGRSLHAAVPDLEWIVNAYTLTFAVLLMPASALGDRFGRKRVLLFGVTLFAAGSISAALAGSATLLIAARALQGVGGAMITPLTLTMLTRAFPAEQRAAAIGLWSGVSGLGLAAGPLIGGAIVNGLSWNAIFWVNVPVAILLLILGNWRLEESRGVPVPLDLPGIALVGLGLFGIVYGLIRGNSLGWGNGQIVLAFAVGVLLLAAFLLRERRTASPMLDLALFLRPGFSAANVAGFLMSAGMFGSIFLITLYVQTVLHYTPLRAGLGTMPWTATIMLVAPFAGILAGRIGSRPPVIVGLTAQATSLFWLSHVTSLTTPYHALLPVFILGGLGMGLVFAPLSAAVMGTIDEAHSGQASGSYNAFRELGGVFGVAILGAVFQHVATTPAAFLSGFHTALVSGAVLLLVGLLSAFNLPGAVRLSTSLPEHASAAAVV